MTLDQLTSRRTLTTLMLCIGLIQVAAYYLAGTLASPDGSMAVPQPDTLLYCQAARRIAEGHPFSFSEGAAACTGTTSVLYPFILAIPYLLGAKGDALLTAGFILNALFYIIFLLGWAKALEIWLEKPLARLTAALLIALSGQIAFCAMAQSDIGCWLAVSGWFAAGLAMRNRLVYGAVLIAGPWLRPEGMVLAIAFGMVWLALAIHLRRTRENSQNFALGKDATVLALAAISCIGVFALNYALTGQMQFSSVANKGYFKKLPFCMAVDQTVVDGLKMLKDYIFGLATSSPRDMTVVPFLAAVFIWLGFFRRSWRSPRDMGLAVMLLAAGGTLFTVAQSGWQGTNFDRYIVWTIPLLTVFLSEGIAVAGEALQARKASALLPFAVCVAFSAATAVFAACRFHSSSMSTDLMRLFATEMDAKLPPNVSVGALGSAGIAYKLGDRPFRHLWGIYSPEFTVKTVPAVSEILKNEPRKRFDYWFLKPDLIAAPLGDHMEECYGENVLTGPSGMEVRMAKWDAYDWSATPKTITPDGMKQIARVDVGHEADEIASDYETIDRYGRQALEAYTIVDKLNGRTAIDAARLLAGGDAMTVPLEPGKNTMVVMRTYPQKVEKRTEDGGVIASTYAFANPLKMKVTVDGQDAGMVSVAYSTNGFSDVSFTIPGAAIGQTPCRIAFLGDHIAAGYWFYQ